MTTMTTIEAVIVVVSLTLLAITVANYRWKFLPKPLRIVVEGLGVLGLSLVLANVMMWWLAAHPLAVDRVAIAADKAGVVVHERPGNIYKPGQWKVDDQWRLCYIENEPGHDYTLMCDATNDAPAFEPLVAE